MNILPLLHPPHHPKDSLCLQVLLGASSPADRSSGGEELQTNRSRSQIEVDSLASILRKSVYLLCSINLPHPSPDTYTGSDGAAEATGSGASGNQRELLLDKSRVELDRIEQSGLPIFLINTGRNLASHSPATGSSSVPLSGHTSVTSPSTPTTATTTDKLRNTRLDTDWFRHFLAKSFRQRYPVDRLPVLVAIWQVAVRAGHRTLERLIGELVDQVAHEEANSCAEEELLQLSQPGSFWLTWCKRYRQNEELLRDIDGHEQQQPSKALPVASRLFG